ncbi:MAG: hypothetical protein K2N72_11340 [Oscillospiraceae bacterium]|nr:hypothetical protein [Oscillospiraceae bacterium]
MKIISDIRIYKSNWENINGNSLPDGFADKSLNIMINRIVMKLREYKFSLGDFDHLYINFTTCIKENTVMPAKRSVDRYHPWYRYYDFGIGRGLFDEIDRSANYDLLLGFIKTTLTTCFAHSENDREVIEKAFDEALSLGEDMLMVFKTKQGAKYKAVIYLRYTDEGKYFPLLCVYDENGAEILRQDMPMSHDLFMLGEIQLSSKKVTVKPRKNVFAQAQDLSPISFDLKK